MNQEIIRHRLEILDLKQWWVAEMVGVNPSTLKRWLNGRTNTARYRHVERLARTLQIEPREILT